LKCNGSHTFFSSCLDPGLSAGADFQWRRWLSVEVGGRLRSGGDGYLYSGGGRFSSGGGIGSKPGESVGGGMGKLKTL